jgi:hypothetical protein
MTGAFAPNNRRGFLAGGKPELMDTIEFGQVALEGF